MQFYMPGAHEMIDSLDEFADHMAWLASLRDEEIDEFVLQHERMLRERETGE